MMKTITQQEALELIRSTKGHIFTVVFIKKDGTPRQMTCRLDVKKGVTGKGLKFDPLSKGLLPVFEMLQIDHSENDKHFRMINLKTLREITIEKEHYKVAA